MSRRNITRRGVLRGLLAGGAAMALPLPRLAMAMGPNGERFVDGRPVPPKFMVWFFGNGIDPQSWHPAGNGGTGSDWRLSETLAPLAPFKRYLSVLSGFEVKTGGAHVGGCAGAMTGAEPNEVGGASLPSIDQIVAAQIGTGSRFRSLEVGLSKATPAGPQPLLHATSHTADGSPNYPEYDPQRLFARLFGLASVPRSVRTARRSVLDFVLKDFNALEKHVGRADKARLQAHAQGIRDLEKRLANSMQACEVMAPGSDIQADNREEAPAILNDAMSRMMTMAMACDLTHVINYTHTLPAAHVYYRHLGEDFERSFHEDIVHLVDGIPNGYGLVRAGVTYAMECLATTLQHMQDTPSAPGGTLLDEIGILATSDVSYGWSHGMEDFPVLIAGLGAGAFKGDVHVNTGGQRTMSEVLLALANAYGANMSALGRGSSRATATVGQILA